MIEVNKDGKGIEKWATTAIRPNNKTTKWVNKWKAFALKLVLH